MNLRELYGGISEVRKAALHRMVDAQAAFNATRWRACMYLAGYGVECQLKAALMKMHGCFNLKELAELLIDKDVIEGPKEVYTHSLEKLLALTGRVDAVRANETVVRHFSVVNRWIPAWRYTADLSGSDEAEQFLEAAREFRHWVEVNV